MNENISIKVQETKSSFDNLYGVSLHIFNNEHIINENDDFDLKKNI